MIIKIGKFDFLLLAVAYTNLIARPSKSALVTLIVALFFSIMFTKGAVLTKHK